MISLIATEFGDDNDNDEEEDEEEGGVSRRRLQSTHSMPPTPSYPQGRSQLTRTNSEPPPPPPPPMPDVVMSPKHSPCSLHRSEEGDLSSPSSSKPSSPRSAHATVEDEEEDGHEEVGSSQSMFMRRSSQRSKYDFVDNQKQCRERERER